MRLPKLKLSAGLLRLAYKFIDVEASGEAAEPDARIVEYAFALSKLGALTPGKVLDVGCASRVNYLPAALASQGWDVTGIDTRTFQFEYPNFAFVHGDMRKTQFPDASFDAVYAVSSLEHFGLSGRYNIREDDLDADAKSVDEIKRILRPGGSFIVTIPCGVREILLPPTRIYDLAALNELFSGWQVADQVYWLHQGGRLRSCSDGEAEQVKTKVGTTEAISLLELIRPG